MTCVHEEQYCEGDCKKDILYLEPKDSPLLGMIKDLKPYKGPPLEWLDDDLEPQTWTQIFITEIRHDKKEEETDSISDHSDVQPA